MWPWYEPACAAALRSLGCATVEFGWSSDFFDWTPGHLQPIPRSFALRLQNRFLVGPAVNALNKRLIRIARSERPDIIWMYNATHIYAKTVRQLRNLEPRPKLVAYTNDNPFGANAAYWRHFREAIPLFDHHFVYRHSNIGDLKRLGITNVSLLRSYFIPEEDYRSIPAADERFVSDVVFVGHYEDDNRLRALRKLSGAGVRLKLFGPGWRAAENLVDTSEPLRSQFPVYPVLGEDYRKAISGASVALSFLSKINHDTYTRRNFQIPAIGTFMLSEYSDDLSSLFTEGVEAEFFRSDEELLAKVQYYLRHPDLRQRIAAKGHERVLRDRHDVRSRMRFLLNRLLPADADNRATAETFEREAQHASLSDAATDFK